MTDQGFAKKRAGAEQRTECADQARAFSERAKVNARRGQAAEKRRQKPRRLLGVGGVGERVDDSPREVRVAVARRSAQRAVGRTRECEQVAREIGRCCRAETLGRRRRQRWFIQSIQRRPQPLERRVAKRLAPERSKTPGHARAHCGELKRQSLSVVIAEGSRDPRE
jgi:hypothetical protein